MNARSLGMSAAILKQYRYGLRKRQSAGLIFLPLPIAAMLTYFAVTLDQPINVRGWWLTAAQGRIFFGVFAALTTIGALLISTLVLLSACHTRRVALTESHVIVPRPTRLGLSRDEIEVAFHTIRSASVREFIGSAQLLRMEYSDGKVVNIPSNMFQSRAEFDEFCRAIQEAVGTTDRRGF